MTTPEKSLSASHPLPGHRGEAGRPWQSLASDYEAARSRADSLDSLVEWPAQRAMLGDVSGLSILDLGCGNGGKLASLAQAGAAQCVGIDISGEFVTEHLDSLELVSADFNSFDSLHEVEGRKFDRILFLQSFGYAKDPVGILRRARAVLNDDGFILLTRTQPLRYALERAEVNDTLVGDEYFASGEFTYASGWNRDISMTKQRYTISNLLNTIAQAGLWIEAAEEPSLSDEQKRDFPEKHAWANKYLAGILMFKLRPLTEVGGLCQSPMSGTSLGGVG
ncbi:class I SAM-dependent methyltransferase [Arthrobacter sp. RCC_34]|uniref:class I SAM-dependent methyltransferase n=1 Tax=Arthrobacter sp. RCC_34 TaxID=3239230 RepID=UPI003523F3BA